MRNSSISGTILVAVDAVASSSKFRRRYMVTPTATSTTRMMAAPAPPTTTAHIRETSGGGRGRFQLAKQTTKERMEDMPPAITHGGVVRCGWLGLGLESCSSLATLNYLAKRKGSELAWACSRMLGNTRSGRSRTSPRRCSRSSSTNHSSSTWCRPSPPGSHCMRCSSSKCLRCRPDSRPRCPDLRSRDDVAVVARRIQALLLQTHTRSGPGHPARPNPS